MTFNGSFVVALLQLECRAEPVQIRSCVKPSARTYFGCAEAIVEFHHTCKTPPKLPKLSESRFKLVIDLED